jgi:hypothetical protein
MSIIIRNIGKITIIFNLPSLSSIQSDASEDPVPTLFDPSPHAV